MIWTNEYLNRIALDAEIEIAKETQSIVDRISIDTRVGIEGYLLPEYVQNIRKVLWKGIRLEPVSQIEYENWIWEMDTYIPPADRGAFDVLAFNPEFDIGVGVSDDESQASHQGKPWRYFFSTFGENVIVFNPGIDEVIASQTSGLWGPEIENTVIIEFYRVPDGTTYKIPEYIRRRTIKNYVLWKAFEKEGAGQNLQAADYHKNRYLIQLKKAKLIIGRVYSAELDYRESYPSEGFYRKPARPVLPANYGIVVEDWDNYE